MKRFWMAGLAAAAMFAATAGSASAEPTVKEYQDAAPGAKDVYKLYLNAEEEAFGWYNAALEGKKLTALYCPPRDVALSSDDTVALFDAFIADHKNVDLTKYPVGLVLITALQDKYPCS
ncbi:MAG: hypothetical protein JWP35_3642 [Caulobacter sp.]|nr:hypothetical protein [Caulobacter sp.]